MRTKDKLLVDEAAESAHVLSTFSANQKATNPAMRTFLVSYDLANPAMNQPYLADAIMALGEAWARPLANVWYLRTNGSQEAIEGRLARLLDEHDGLLVQAVREEAAFRNTGLRWFRQRRREEDAANNVIAFRTPAEVSFQQGEALDEPAPLRAAS
jgi:hypothetical protein